MLRSIFSGSLLMIFCILAVDVNASSFSLESQINTRVSYDDNINFTAINSESSSIVTITPETKLTYESDSWETAMAARVSGTSYSTQLQNQINGHLDLETAYKDSRNIYSVDAAYDNISARASEDINSIGLISEQIKTRKLRLTPKFTRLLTERVSLSLNYSYSDVSYNPDTQGAHLPYETQSTTGTVEYKLSQKSKLNLALSALDYTSENNISEYQMLSSRFGVVHNFSKMINAQMFAGVNTRDFLTRSSENFLFSGSIVTGTQAVENSSSGSIFEAVIDAKWIEFRASRDAVFNDIGGLDQTDKVFAKLRMQVTSLIGITLTMDRAKINEVNDNIVDQSRVVTRINPSMIFTLSRNLSLRAEYHFQEQEYVNLPQETYERNRFFVSLTYNLPTI